MLVFPEADAGWLAPVVLVPWLLLLVAAPSGREAALRGWLGGAGFVAAVHHWLLPVTGPFLVLVALLVGALWAPWGVVVRRASAPPATARRALGALLVVPAAWLMIELVRSAEQLAGPWGLLGASQWQAQVGRDLAALGGTWLVSAVLVALNTAVALALSRGPRAPVLIAAGALVGAALAWSAAYSPPLGRTVTVAAVQPGPIVDTEARFAASERLTGPLAGRDVDLVVWGESSVGADLDARPDLAARLATLSRQVGAPVLVNVDARPRADLGIRKSSVLVGPDGVLARYDKMRLVPFGEYVPMRPLLGWLGRYTDVAAQDRVRGEEPVLMDVDGTRVGPLVCFESAFPDMTRALARAGADVVVVQSATWTFQESWAPEQHASLAAMRAAESGRPVLHATLTGQTAAFDAAGRPAGPPLPTDRTGSVVYELATASGRTPFVAAGDWVLLGAGAVLVVWLGRGAVRLSRGRGRRGGGSC